MAKITSYEKVSALNDNNVFLIDGDEGTKTITAKNLARELGSVLKPNNNISLSDSLVIKTADGTHSITAGNLFYGLLDAVASKHMHRNIIRGKNLGSGITAAQAAAIQNGTFEGLWIGDYWKIGDTVWRIVDMDYWYNSGDEPCQEHHVVVMPDKSLYDAAMNDNPYVIANVAHVGGTEIEPIEFWTYGGYVGSDMYKTHLNQAKATISSAFGSSNILNHREALINDVSEEGYSSGFTWVDSTVEIPNEVMIYGSHTLNVRPEGVENSVGYYTIDSRQLAIYRMRSDFSTRTTFWLRDVASTQNFAYSQGRGSVYERIASQEYGVRPVFGITGAKATI